ncbi:MAG: peptide chain release factor 2 [Deltaproteobacteria bacterium]|nr:peptide chain release factor 2 [Deltaproteobacteria bacterium]
MQDRITIASDKIKKLKSSMHIEAKAAEIKILDAEIASPTFWDDSQKAASIQKQRRILSDIVAAFISVEKDIADLNDLLELAQEDPEFESEFETQLVSVESKIERLEFKKMLGGEMDASSAIVSINSGAGGTESQDWVSMLLRMYLRWAERHDYKAHIVDELAGEEAGYKNVTLTIEGDYVFGYLQAESGVHRLVRISPFDSNSRRHTSFASVSVVPQLDDTIEIEINEGDLRIDTYRASGAGGQHVNTTDSAVRITHLPTGIVAQCQNERSQHKNKAQAMKILKSRMYEKQREEQEKKKAEAEGKKMGIDFGSQIRSYVLHPYQMIKDHRTNFESGKTQAVLDGEIDEFIQEFLLSREQ